MANADQPADLVWFVDHPYGPLAPSEASEQSRPTIRRMRNDVASKMDTKKLIETVQQFTCVYDYRDKHYKNALYKMSAWDNIAMKMNLMSKGTNKEIMTSDLCKTRWKVIRDSYTKYKRQLATVHDKRLVQYIWADQLKFLDETTASFRHDKRKEHYDKRKEHYDKRKEHYDKRKEHSQSSSEEQEQNDSEPSQPFSASTTLFPRLEAKKQKTDATYLDGNDHLFLSYSKALGKLPVRKRTEIKIKLARMFADAENGEFANDVVPSTSTLTDVPSTSTMTNVPSTSTTDTFMLTESKPFTVKMEIEEPTQSEEKTDKDATDVKVSSPSCHSPGAILPDLPQPAEDPDKNCGLSKDASSSETQAWLTRHRFAQHAATFANFSGADLLRLSRDDIIQICGLPDGIRLFNDLHAKRIAPRLTLYVCAGGAGVHSALYLHECRAAELQRKLAALVDHGKECDSVLVAGPHGARVRLTDEVVRHLADHATYTLARDAAALLLARTH